MGAIELDVMMDEKRRVCRRFSSIMGREAMRS
jgi:hypothetical protein